MPADMQIFLLIFTLFYMFVLLIYRELKNKHNEHNYFFEMYITVNDRFNDLLRLFPGFPGSFFAERR